MKRTDALSKIKHCGYIENLDGASKIQISKGIGSAAARQAYTAGKKLKDLELPCDCTDCTAKKMEGIRKGA